AARRAPPPTRTCTSGAATAAAAPGRWGRSSCPKSLPRLRPGSVRNASYRRMGRESGTRRKGHEMDWKLELVARPVTDVGRAKQFYVQQLGFNADHDATVSDELRFVQLTPPGSACSIAIGLGITDAAPGSVRGMQVVVEDVAKAREELLDRKVDVSEVHE